jgi:hypothetical protein
MFLAQVEEVAAQRVKTLFLYGTEDGLRERFDQARAGRLGEIMDEGGSTVDVAMLDGPVHALTTLEVQDAFVDRVESWIADLERR